MKSILLLCAIVVTATSAFADLKSEVTTYNKSFAAAMKKRDFAALEKMMKAGMTADFVYEEGGKKQDAKTMLASMKMGLGMLKKVDSAESKILSIKESGNKATIVTERSMSGTMSGEDKKDHKMVHVGVTTDTMVKVNGKWKMAKMIWKTKTATLDGKPMPMPGG